VLIHVYVKGRNVIPSVTHTLIQRKYMTSTEQNVMSKNTKPRFYVIVAIIYVRNIIQYNQQTSESDLDLIDSVTMGI